MIIAVLLILTGVGVWCYPYITDQLYQLQVERELDIFSTEKDTENPSLEKLYQDLKQKNEQLFREKQKNLTDAFSYEQNTINLKEYGLSGNYIGFIEIPKMEVTLPIYLGANEENMKKGAVHLTQTSYPIGGNNTNCVIAAHRGYSKTAMFREIENLETGDLIYIQNFRETLTYQVKECCVINPTDVDRLLIQEGKDMLTLLTCHPYRYHYQRYVVFCEKKEFW